MNLTDYLKEEWVPALGCTEPASIALAAATAVEGLEGDVISISLTVDPNIYKNCYAVGIPCSGYKTGILWAVAIGAHIKDHSLGLECFKTVNEGMIDSAGKLIDSNKIDVEVDTNKRELFIDCVIKTEGGRGRSVIARDHTNIVHVEKDGEIKLDKDEKVHSNKSAFREEIAAMSTEEMIALARSASDEDRKALRHGVELNRRIAEHGLTLLPKRFVELASKEPLSKISTLVCAGVYARMSGEDFPVMSLAGSGNKGITAAIPLTMQGKLLNCKQNAIDEALALACLVTSATTHYLGALSAVCGCSNAAGIGLAAGLVLLEEGGPDAIGLAINNMVGNVSGMICDGAKIGCALKTMTAVDAAFRAASLAMSGVGIPPSDGIVGESGRESLKNLGRIVTHGMIATDSEILKIMQGKLKKKA